VEPEIEFDSEAMKHIEHCESVENTPDFEMPDDFFITEPYEHQKKALAFAYRNIRCGLLLDMGLGKTKIVVDLLRMLKKKALVLSPVVGLETWAHEVEVHSGGEMSAVCVKGTPKKKKDGIAASTECDVLVVGYDTAKGESYQHVILDSFPYEVIVADESHNLRGPFTARTKAAKALASKAFRRIILSGTPSLGNPMHLYGQLAFLGDYIPAETYWTFKKHYLVTAKGNDKFVVGYKNLDLLHRKVHRISLCKKKEECLDLPERTVIDITYDSTPEQRKMYNDLVDGALVDLGSGELYESDNAAVTLGKLLQVMSGFIHLPAPPVCDDCVNLQQCALEEIRPFTPACSEHPEPYERKTQRLKSSPKLDALDDLLDNILAEESNKVIVWAYFIEELDMIEERLREKDVGYIRIDGSNSRRGQELSKEFNEDPTTRIWLGQVGTGVALTLNAATYMVYYGWTFKLDSFLQSQDRNYRIGQEHPVFVYRMAARRSVEEFVMRALEAKLDLAETLVSRIDCVLCKHSSRCLEDGVEPFTKGCIHKSRVDKKVIRPSKL
jgi:SNF2 family DNA or RNA helicase